MTSIGHGGSEVSSGAVHQLGGAKSVSLAIWFSALVYGSPESA